MAILKSAIARAVGLESRLSRRSFLWGALGVSTLTLLPGSLNTAYAGNFAELIDLDLQQRHEPNPLNPAEFRPFLHGVASGDPLPNSVVLWTRATPSLEAVPGSGKGEPVKVRWEVALDFEFADIVSSGVEIAEAKHDHTVHVDPWNLQPATEYFYRFRIEGGDFDGTYSRIGRTKTAPAPEDTPTELNVAVCSCANFESGYFSAYSDIAHRAADNAIDVVVHLGDYIYEYASGSHAGKYGVVRSHEPTWEIVSLADYRTRYGRYRRDTELQAAHAAAPWVVMWDDHEIANNAWEHGAPGHTGWNGDWQLRRAAAMQAYLEWLPVRGQAPSQGGHIYRSLRFGTLAELTMLDLRSYRDRPEKLNIKRSLSEERTIMGAEQFAWLQRKLENPQTTWNVVGTSVMLTPISLLEMDSTIGNAVQNLIGEGCEGVPYNLDQWDGYVADRRRLFQSLHRRKTEHPDVSTVFLAGDIHSEWAAELEYEGVRVGAELVCTSVSAANIDDGLGVPANSPVSTEAEAHLLRTNPHVKHVDLDAHGYSLVRITATQVSMRFMRVDDVTVAGSAIRPAGTALFDGHGVRHE
ncbi:alkaline phosphatase D family protein [Corynebacterium sp. H127]|uniref:alkaline phosphatase D family protein n=1 Tax=Corynebacterium sp. H127 TaxID=3133418 RepID=UPI0030A451B5